MHINTNYLPLLLFFLPFTVAAPPPNTPPGNPPSSPGSYKSFRDSSASYDSFSSSGSDLSDSGPTTAVTPPSLPRLNVPRLSLPGGLDSPPTSSPPGTPMPFASPKASSRDSLHSPPNSNPGSLPGSPRLSPQGSPRLSPQGSPRLSPQGSPRLSPPGSPDSGSVASTPPPGSPGVASVSSGPGSWGSLASSPDASPHSSPRTRFPISTNKIDCAPAPGIPPQPADCHRAIAMILQVRLSSSARTRRFALPAIFKAGSCMVTVSPDDTWTWRLGGRTKPFALPLPDTMVAGDMYGGVWPNVKRQASRIVRKCFGFAPGARRGGGGIMGEVVTKSPLGGKEFPYQVKVEAVPRGFPGDGWRAIRVGGWDVAKDRMLEVEYNVYEPGGVASGKGTRGVWGRRREVAP
ncbi:hypothetical protein MMC30_002437 [Trapelia coarctata]|nr:hypothetical protein [Trapelia coarctata]